MLLQELGVSKKTLDRLKKKEIYTVEDMLHFYPTAYRDYTNIGICQKQKFVMGSG